MPKPRSGESKKAFIARCMGDDEAVASFPDNDQRFAFCNSVYARARNMTQQLAVTVASLNAAALRAEQFMGRDYLVVPAVLVQGQVLNNNLGTTFLPPDEITDAWAQEWNFAPVVIHDHPTARGVAVSARTPEILDSRGVGFVFHARTSRNGQVQLKGEVWLDLARAEELSELQTIVQRLRVGEKVELSTGFAATTEETPGAYNGESYERVLHPQGADHLAIFVDSVGACSLKDGCGLGVQQQHPPTEGGDAMQEGDNERGMVLKLMHSLAGLLSSKATVEPADNGGGGCGGCEDDDEWKAAANMGAGVEARLLLRRLKALDMTREQIGDAVGRSASSISAMERGETLNPAEEVLEKLRNLARQRMSGNAEDRSDEERRMMLASALDATFGGTNKMVWIDAVYSSRKEVIFGIAKDELAGGRTEELFSSKFTVSEENGTEITFADPTEVVRRVIYEPVGNATTATTEEKQMQTEKEKQEQAALEAKKKEDEQAQLAANEAAKKKEADEAAAAEAAKKKEADEQAANEAAAKKEKDEKEGAEKDEVITALQKTIEEQGKTIVTQGEQIASLQATVAPAVEERERERKTLVEELAANEAVPFDQAELEAKPVDELRKLKAMARGESYAGRGGPHIAAQTEEQQFMPSKPYWEKPGDETSKKKDGE